MVLGCSKSNVISRNDIDNVSRTRAGIDGRLNRAIDIRSADWRLNNILAIGLQIPVLSIGLAKLIIIDADDCRRTEFELGIALTTNFNNLDTVRCAGSGEGPMPPLLRTLTTPRPVVSPVTTILSVSLAAPPSLSLVFSTNDPLSIVRLPTVSALYGVAESNSIVPSLVRAPTSEEPDISQYEVLSTATLVTPLPAPVQMLLLDKLASITASLDSTTISPESTTLPSAANMVVEPAAACSKVPLPPTTCVPFLSSKPTLPPDVLKPGHLLSQSENRLQRPCYRSPKRYPRHLHPKHARSCL